MNDPTVYPKPDATHGSYHWAFERLISASLVPICAVAAAKHGMSGVVDGVLSVTLLLHSHIGFENVVTDYVEKRKFPVAGPALNWFIRSFTVASAIGLYGTYASAGLTSRVQHECVYFAQTTCALASFWPCVRRLLAVRTHTDTSLLGA